MTLYVQCCETASVVNYINKNVINNNEICLKIGDTKDVGDDSHMGKGK